MSDNNTKTEIIEYDVEKIKDENNQNACERSGVDVADLGLELPGDIFKDFNLGENPL